MFLVITPHTHSFNCCNTIGWVGRDNHGREADGSFRPFMGAAQPPPGVLKEDFVTVIIEVGYSQCLDGARGLRAKAQQWLTQYPTVIYIVIIHISEKCNMLKVSVNTSKSPFIPSFLLFINSLLVLG